MIKNRNIAMNAGIDPNKILGGGIAGAGEIFYVAKSGTAAHTYLQTRVDNTHLFTYDATSNANAIQDALDQCVSERNDYVLVMPSSTDYDTGATLTMSKTCVHLIAPGGLGRPYGANRSATLDAATTAATITITARGCEVAGFWIRGYTEQGCITSTGVGVNLHHNDLAITCTTAAAYGITIGAAGMGSMVAYNHIFSNAGSGTWLHGIDVSPSATRTQVIGNVINVSNASTCTNGIDTTTIGTVMGAAMINVIGNYLFEQPAITGTGASTLTAGIRVGTGGFAADNKIGIATEANGVIGGTANQSFITNYEASSGGTLLT